jgi:hypothetical protein
MLRHLFCIAICILISKKYPSILQVIIRFCNRRILYKLFFCVKLFKTLLLETSTLIVTIIYPNYIDQVCHVCTTIIFNLTTHNDSPKKRTALKHKCLKKKSTRRGQLWRILSRMIKACVQKCLEIL